MLNDVIRSFYSPPRLLDDTLWDESLWDTRHRPANWIILLKSMTGPKFRSRIIPRTIRGTELTTTAAQIPRYERKRKCLAAYLRRLAHQIRARHPDVNPFIEWA